MTKTTIVTKQIVLEDGTLETVIITQPITKKPLLQSDTANHIISKQNTLIDELNNILFNLLILFAMLEASSISFKSSE